MTKAQAATARIILNLAEIAQLARQEPITFWFSGLRVEVALQRGLTPRLLIGQMMDLLANGARNDDGVNPVDPPEAREFLPNKRRPRK